MFWENGKRAQHVGKQVNGPIVSKLKQLCENLLMLCVVQINKKENDKNKENELPNIINGVQRVFI